MEQDYKLIEDYIAGSLPESQRAEFELRLGKDAAFAEAFQLQKSMNAFLVKENKKGTLISQLEELGEKHFNSPPQARIVPFYRRKIFAGLAIAASIAILVFAINSLFQKPLYNQYAMHQAINLVEKGDSDQLAVTAQNQFNDKDYTNAFQSLTKYLLESPEDTKAMLAKGICALELDKTAEAISIFNQIHLGDSALKNNGTWYLALSYLKQNNLEKTKEYLKLIPKSDQFLSTKANALLGKMEE
ncbi:MAG: tetratricopeptide (TPR) repeat protein [Saprospiraceae bacterium]|jgi:tetratricopeptide (TPR) repeat protein